MKYKKGGYYTIDGNIIKFINMSINNEVYYEYILFKSKAFRNSGIILISGDMQEANINEILEIEKHIHNYNVPIKLTERDVNEIDRNEYCYDVRNAETDEEKEELVTNAYLNGIEAGRKYIKIDTWFNKAYPVLDTDIIVYFDDETYCIGYLSLEIISNKLCYEWFDTKDKVLNNVVGWKNI